MFNFKTGIDPQTSADLIRKTKRAWAKCPQGMTLAEYGQIAPTWQAKAEATILIDAAAFIQARAERLPFVGTVYHVDIFRDLARRYPMPMLEQILNAHVGIEYQCDSLYTIDFDALKAFAEG